MGKRRKGREIVLQSMYASLISGAKLADTLEAQLERRASADETGGFARDLADKVRRNGGEVEAWLNSLISARWDPARVGKLESVILTIGLCELRYSPEVPYRVVINEACELARRYCDDGAVGFVNAVLDRAAAETYPELKSADAAAAKSAAHDSGAPPADPDRAGSKGKGSA